MPGVCAHFEVRITRNYGSWPFEHRIASVSQFDFSVGEVGNGDAGLLEFPCDLIFDFRHNFAKL